MTRKPRTSSQGSGYHMTIKMMANDPTAEQIAERCTEIQAEWSEEERQKKLVGGRRVIVEVTVTRFLFGE